MKTQTNSEKMVTNVIKVWVGILLVSVLTLIVQISYAAPRPGNSKVKAHETLTPGYYWTIEVNKQGNPASFVRFYNAKNELVYEEYLKGTELNIDRKAVRRKLNRLLAGFTSQQLYQQTF